MKSKIITMAVIAVVLYGCNPPTRNLANVRTIQGLYIFINVDPMANYTLLGKEIELNAIQGILDSTKTKEGFFEKAGAVLVEGYKDIDFASKLERMVDRVRDKYPDAEGIIFEGKMNSCQAIKFK